MGSELPESIGRNKEAKVRKSWDELPSPASPAVFTTCPTHLELVSDDVSFTVLTHPAPGKIAEHFWSWSII